MSKQLQWIAGGVLACLLVLVAGWFVFVKSAHDDVDAARRRAATAEASSRQAALQLQQLQALKADLPRHQAQLAAVSAAIPASTQVSTVIRSLTSAAQDSGVALLTIAPAVPAAVSSPAGLSSVDVTIKVQGSYFATEQFISDVQNLGRAVLVVGVDMKAVVGAGSGSGTGPVASHLGDLATSMTVRLFSGTLPSAATAATATGKSSTAVAN
jgi:Tfp pilus assembly protein PilO